MKVDLIGGGTVPVWTFHFDKTNSLFGQIPKYKVWDSALLAERCVQGSQNFGDKLRNLNADRSKVTVGFGDHVDSARSDAARVQPRTGFPWAKLCAKHSKFSRHWPPLKLDQGLLPPAT